MSHSDLHEAPPEGFSAKNAAREPEGERIRKELIEFLERNKISSICLDTPLHYVDIQSAKLPPRIKNVLSKWGSVYVVDGSPVVIQPERPENWNDNVVPPMTHPLGRHWEQPSLDRVVIDNETAIMDQEAFEWLAEYSASMPSGVYEGAGLVCMRGGGRSNYQRTRLAAALVRLQQDRAGACEQSPAAHLDRGDRMRPTKDWLITDTHFNHHRLVTEGWRPAGYETAIKANWCRLVAEQDVVYHLGDVILGRASELKGILDALPGIKVLIKGNHDQESNGWYMRHGFQFCAQAVLYKGVYLTHAPQVCLPDGAVLNVHGHLHDRADRRGYETLPWQKLLALEHVGYAPVEFDKFCGLSAQALALLA